MIWQSILLNFININLLIFLYNILKNCCNYYINEIQKGLVIYENFIAKLYQKFNLF